MESAYSSLLTVDDCFGKYCVEALFRVSFDVLYLESKTTFQKAERRYYRQLARIWFKARRSNEDLDRKLSTAMFPVPNKFSKYPCIVIDSINHPVQSYTYSELVRTNLEIFMPSME